MPTLITVYGSFVGYRIDQTADKYMVFCTEQAGDYSITVLHSFFASEVVGILEGVKVDVTRL